MTRCIVYSNETGSREGVYFTTDLEMDASECIPPNCSLDLDFTIADEFPDAFPMDYNLEK